MFVARKMLDMEPTDSRRPVLTALSPEQVRIAETAFAKLADRQQHGLIVSRQAGAPTGTNPIPAL